MRVATWMLKPFVSVVGFKKFCAGFPLKGDLRTKIKFPTGFLKTMLAEGHEALVFRVLPEGLRPPRTRVLEGQVDHFGLILPIAILNFQLKSITHPMADFRNPTNPSGVGFKPTSPSHHTWQRRLNPVSLSLNATVAVALLSWNRLTQDVFFEMSTWPNLSAKKSPRN